MNDFGEVILRDGIPIEKGVVLTREYLDANQELFTRYLDLWIRYPDLLLDIIQDSTDAVHFHLMPFQSRTTRSNALQIYILDCYPCYF